MRAIRTPTINDPMNTPALAKTEIKNESTPNPVSAKDVKTLYKIIATASFNADSPKIIMYSRRSTFAGRRAKTVTGSVEDINDPNTREDMNDSSPSIAKLNPYIRTEVTNVEYSAPAKAYAIMSIMFWKKKIFCILKPPFNISFINLLQR
jgi:hypothetical protein